MIRRYYTRGDIILTVVLIILSLTSVAWVKVLSDGGGHIVVSVDGRRMLELSLDRDVTTSVTGKLGEMVIDVKNGEVDVIESACPHGYCTHMGPIRHRGEVIVCVPNHVMISITGGSDGESFDGVTQ
jgi:hypothetical protein